jgi:phytoene dehydrogenase-like protein
VIHLAIREGLEFPARPGDPIARLRLTGPDVDGLEKTFDPVKYETFGERQALEVWVPSLENPDLAPPGHHVVSILATGVPYRLAEGWTEAARKRLGDQTVAALGVHAPELPARVLGREVLAPPDLEARYGVVEGHLYHGDHALDQLLFRPTADCARYRTPVEGLFLCGSGSFPGGGVTGAPGLLAARTILGG